MPDLSFRPPTGSIPESPGVYRFRDRHGRVIYVGKAKSLRSRLQSYFADPFTLHPRTRSLMSEAADVDWVVVGSEVEALQLEYSWIKEFDPRFNVKYRDDKSYPYLAVTLGEEFPRALVTRGAKRVGTRYFGPYSHAWAIRASLDALLRVFPMRTCSSGVFARARRSGRPCLLADIGKCSAPCVGRVTPEEHRDIALELCSFLGGQARTFQRRLTDMMAAAAQAQDYERAARLRDDLQALERALERNAVVFDESVDADVVGMAADDLEIAFEVFHVRDGRIRGQRSYVVERVDDAELPTYVGRLLLALAEDSGEIPPEILVPTSVTQDVRDWLRWRREARVDVRMPQRGPKKDLQATVQANAEQRLALHKSRRSGDLTARGRALEDLRSALDLELAPLRIEGVDISHLGGTEVVGSLVVFEDGAPKPSDYRSYTISPEGSTDDTAAVYEVVYRRFRPREVGETDKPSRFAYPPNLLVIDGAQPQVQAAQRALTDRGVTDVTVIGLAKRLEEVWRADNSEPVILPRSSEGLYLLQRLRDEAHRRAITHQRRRRKASVKGSALHDIPGLGPARARALLQRFGSVAKISRCSASELAEVDGIGPVLAEAIRAALAPDEMLEVAEGET